MLVFFERHEHVWEYQNDFDMKILTGLGLIDLTEIVFAERNRLVPVLKGGRVEHGRTLVL